MQTEKRDGLITMGLRGKIIFGFCGLILASLLAACGFIYWQNMQLTRQHNLDLAQGELEKTADRMLSRLHVARGSLLTLRGVPPVEAIMRARAAGGIDPLSGDDLNVWKRRLQKIFVAFLSHGSTFEKLRYFNERGQEMVRVGVIRGEVHITPESALQNKFNRQYFQQAVNLKEGKIYVGNMMLSREHGRVSEPNVAVMHLAVPVLNAAHGMAGMLVANLLGEHLMGVIPTDKHGIRNYLFDERGRFLKHPLQSKRFADELERDYTAADAFPNLFAALQTEQRHIDFYQQQDSSSQARLFEKIYFDPADHHRYWVLLRSMPASLLTSQLDGTGNTLLWLGFMITALTLILVSWMATQKIMFPIRQLVAAAEGLKQGDLSIRLPVEQVNDEFRTLYRMVNAFVEKQKYAHEELQHEVDDRTAKLAAKSRELEIRSSYDKSYAEGMAVISATYERGKALADILSILARNHAFPVSALFLLDIQHESMVCVATHGACSSLKQQVHIDEGLMGQATKTREMLIVDNLDQENGLRIDAGLLSFTPVALVLSPILYQGKVLGMLELLTSKPMLDLDRYFIERLSIQLGVAFNNFGQYLHLQEITEQLQQQSDEIRQKNSQLEAASRMKSEFLANMSHELRTPLNAIIGFSELIKDGAAGDVNDDQLDFVTEIHASGQHLLALINEILDLSKIEAGKMELNLCDVIVSDIVENSLSIIREQAMKHGLSLHTDIGENIECCSMDMRKVKQILYNLLSNAVKFTPDGGSVSVKASIVTAEEYSARNPQHFVDNGNFLKISVSDNGIGIAEADMERIFLPFEQVDGSMTRSYAGTGLGLILVKAMVELHGGAIAVTSEPDKGSIFTIWLPYIEAETEATTQTSTAALVKHETLAGEQPLALIVEDDYASAELMRRKLEKFDFRTERSVTAEGALYWLESHRPDLIVLDIMLPLTNGWELLVALKKHAHCIDVPVIIASAVAEDNIQKGISLGAAAMLQKPVDGKVLYEVLAELGFSNAETIA